MLWFRGRSRGPGHAEWDAAGEWPNVTLSPSIGVKFGKDGSRPANGDYHWHGFLRAGVFEPC